MLFSVFNFSISFYYHIKSLLIISNFLEKNKVIISNWYQNLDDKLIGNVLDSRLTYYRPLKTLLRTLSKKTQIDRKHINIKKKYKEEMERADIT